MTAGGACGQCTRRSVNLVGASIAQQENSIQLRQLGAKVLVLLERDDDAVVDPADGLRRGIHDLALVQGEKLSSGLWVSRQGECKTIGIRRKHSLGRRRERLRQEVAEAIEKRLAAGIGGTFLCRHLQWKDQVGPARNADLAAYQPIHMGWYLDRRRDFQRRAGAQGDGEEHLIFVAKIHQGAEGQTAWRGKLHGASGDAGWEGPLDAWRFPRVPGVDPIDVPAFVQGEVKADKLGGSGLDRAVEWEQLYGEMLRAHWSVTGAAAATTAVNAVQSNRKYWRRPGITSTARPPVIVAARLIGLDKPVRGYQKGGLRPTVSTSLQPRLRVKETGADKKCRLLILCTGFLRVGGPGLAFETWVFRPNRIYSGETSGLKSETWATHSISDCSFMSGCNFMFDRAKGVLLADSVQAGVLLVDTAVHDHEDAVGFSPFHRFLMANPLLQPQVRDLETNYVFDDFRDVLGGPEYIYQINFPFRRESLDPGSDMPSPLMPWSPSGAPG